MVPAVCPKLDDAPDGAIDALEAAGHRDPAVAAWTIELGQHYDQLDLCAKGGSRGR